LQLGLSTVISTFLGQKQHGRSELSDRKGNMEPGIFEKTRSI